MTVSSGATVAGSAKAALPRMSPRARPSFFRCHVHMVMCALQRNGRLAAAGGGVWAGGLEVAAAARGAAGSRAGAGPALAAAGIDRGVVTSALKFFDSPPFIIFVVALLLRLPPFIIFRHLLSWYCSCERRVQAIRLPKNALTSVHYHGGVQEAGLPVAQCHALLSSRGQPSMGTLAGVVPVAAAEAARAAVGPAGSCARPLRMAARNWRVWYWGLTQVFFSTGHYAIIFWGPLLVQAILGLGQVAGTAPPSAAGEQAPSHGCSHSCCLLLAPASSLRSFERQSRHWSPPRSTWWRRWRCLPMLGVQQHPQHDPPG